MLKNVSLSLSGLMNIKLALKLVSNVGWLQ